MIDDFDSNCPPWSGRLYREAEVSASSICAEQPDVAVKLAESLALLSQRENSEVGFLTTTSAVTKFLAFCAGFFSIGLSATMLPIPLMNIPRMASVVPAVPLRSSKHDGPIVLPQELRVKPGEPTDVKQSQATPRLIPVPTPRREPTKKASVPGYSDPRSSPGSKESSSGSEEVKSVTPSSATPQGQTTPDTRFAVEQEEKNRAPAIPDSRPPPTIELPAPSNLQIVPVE